MEQTKFTLTYKDTGEIKEYLLKEYSIQFNGAIATIFKMSGIKNQIGKDVYAPYLTIPVHRIESVKYE